MNRKDWWHVPPQGGIESYRRRGKFLASSFEEAEFYGRPLDQPQKVTVTNPLVGDEERVHRELFGKIINILDNDKLIENRLSLDARMRDAAFAKGYDSIVIMHPEGFAAFKTKRKIPRSMELKLLCEPAKGWK